MGMIHLEPHPLAGRTVILNDWVAKDPRGMILPGGEFRIEDWVDRLYPQTSWKAETNWATRHYALRQSQTSLPEDEEVLYGKIGAMGHCVHNSELGEVIPPVDRG